MTHSFIRFFILLGCLPLIHTSCKRVGEIMPIKETRELSEFEEKPKLGADSLLRFEGKTNEAPANPLTWEVPDGWQQLEASQMRPINLRFGDSGECYLSMLPGGGGDLLANVNRWRKQMGADDLSPEQSAELPQQILLGLPGVRVEVDGDYTNIGDSEPRSGYRLVGAIATLGDVGLFVKMVGPIAEVEAQMPGFESFISSLRLNLPGAGSEVR